MLTIFLIAKSPYTWVKSFIASLKSHNKSEIDRILAPFAQVHNKLVAVQAKAKAVEDELRSEAAILIAKADTQARAVEQALAAAGKLGDLIGKDATPPAAA